MRKLKAENIAPESERPFEIGDSDTGVIGSDDEILELMLMLRNRNRLRIETQQQRSAFNINSGRISPMSGRARALSTAAITFKLDRDRCRQRADLNCGAVGLGLQDPAKYSA
jgi:hypothetical protein